MHCDNQPSAPASAPGSVLLAVLCLVAVLSFLIITVAVISQQHGGMQAARQGMTRARQLAERGVAVAAHPLIKPGDPLLQTSVSGIERYEATLSTEEGRLNLNALLTEERLPVLERVFISWGMSAGDAQGLVATLMDWVDADDLKRRPDSAEKWDYEQMGFSNLPLNRKLRSLDELDLMMRVNEIGEAKADWKSYFTLRGNGLLDVNTASAEVIAVATGDSLENAKQLVKTRDVVPLKSLEAALAQLGIGGQQTAGLLPLLTLQGPTRRVESIGRAGDARCGIAVIVDMGGGQPHITEWREFSVEGARL